MTELKKHTKILIVEDEQINFIYFQTVFTFCKTRNFEIIHATNGIDAIKIVTETPDLDIILMDIKMPKMDGYQATQEIRKINSQIPIIAQSAFTSEKDRKRALECGCNAYMAKPINADELLQKVESMLPH